MKRVLLLVVILLSFLVTSCNNLVEIDKNEVLSVDYGKEFSILLNRYVKTSDNLYTIKFDSVTTDSRCPEGLMCLWAGVAGIRLIISDNAYVHKTVELYTLNSINRADSAVYNNLKIKMVGLSPYPSLNKKTDYNSYKAKLIISKMK